MFIIFIITGLQMWSFSSLPYCTCQDVNSSRLWFSWLETFSNGKKIIGRKYKYWDKHCQQFNTISCQRLQSLLFDILLQSWGVENVNSWVRHCVCVLEILSAWEESGIERQHSLWMQWTILRLELTKQLQVLTYIDICLWGGVGGFNVIDVGN